MTIGFDLSWRETPGCPRHHVCPSRMAGDFLNLSLTWSKSVENAGYGGNESFFSKIMSKLVKSPAPSSKVDPTSKIGSPTNPGGGSGGLLALEPHVLDGGQAEAWLWDQFRSLSWTPNCFKWSSLLPNKVELVEAKEMTLRPLFVAVSLNCLGRGCGG